MKTHILFRGVLLFFGLSLVLQNSVGASEIPKTTKLGDAPVQAQTDVGLSDANSKDHYNYCRLSFPGERDVIGRYCNGSYGVVHNQYIMDNTCYSTSDLAYRAMINSFACTFAPPVYVGRCHLSYPQQRDINNRYCNQSYGVVYNGAILDNTCHFKMDDAIQRAQNSAVCQDGGGGYNYCQLIGPGVRDRANRYCPNGYGVLYNGYITDNTCYYYSGDAYNKMRSTRTCNERPPYYYGRCRLFYPSERDRYNRYCFNSYGVGYEGQILDNSCYESLDRTAEIMRSKAICQ